ncbi:MAG: hypothetical protein ABR538_14950 [Candidatus Binatia bacterium]
MPQGKFRERGFGLSLLASIAVSAVASSPTPAVAADSGSGRAAADEVPAADYIKKLNDAGIRSGVGAFPPPGTKPLLEGIAVPEDFELPPGYVRHHQTTDDGQPVEPILMYAPDHEFLDAEGRLLAIPEDRVVPADRLPPGLPNRRVQIPSGRAPGDVSR